MGGIFDRTRKELSVLRHEERTQLSQVWAFPFECSMGSTLRRKGEWNHIFVEP